MTPEDRAAWFAQLEDDAQRTARDLIQYLATETPHDRGAFGLAEDALDVIGRMADALDMSLPMVGARGLLVTRDTAADFGLNPTQVAFSTEGIARVCILRPTSAPCAECGARIPKAEPSAFNRFHEPSCSLYEGPDDTASVVETTTRGDR